MQQGSRYVLRLLGRRNTGSEFLPGLIMARELTSGPVQMLNREHLQDFNAIRHYLLDKTQHMIGGFGKLPGDVPGPYYSISIKLKCHSKITLIQTFYTHLLVSLH